MPQSPTTARREFGIRVRNRRTELGLTAAQVAKGLGLSRVYYSKIENAHTVLADTRLPDLVDLLETDEKDALELADLLKAGRHTGWWEKHSAYLEEQFIEFIGLEQGASRVRIFEGRLMTGLAQTEQYATAVVNAATDTPRGEAWRFVEIRMRRQERLTEPEPLEMELLLSEAALVQQFGGPEVLRGQLIKLLELIDSSVARVRVQPFVGTPLGMITSSTVVLFEFPSDHLPTTAWIEGGGLLTLSDDDSLVRSLVLDYELALSSSLDEVDSRALIREKMEEI